MEETIKVSFTRQELAIILTAIDGFLKDKNHAIETAEKLGWDGQNNLCDILALAKDMVCLTEDIKLRIEKKF